MWRMCFLLMQVSQHAPSLQHSSSLQHSPSLQHMSSLGGHTSQQSSQVTAPLAAVLPQLQQILQHGQKQQVCHCLPDDSALIVLPFIAVYFSESTWLRSYFTMQESILHLIQSLSPQDAACRKHHFTCVFLWRTLGILFPSWMQPFCSFTVLTP